MKIKWHPLWVLVALTALPMQAEDISSGFIHGGIYRTYVLHIPDQYDNEDSLPLVINMNGAGLFGLAYAEMTEMSIKADSEGFFVAYPACTDLGGKISWNSGEWYHSSVDDVGFISSLIDTLRAHYAIDTLRIYATGISTGGLMTHRLACELSDRIAAFAPVAAPLICQACNPQRPVSIMHFHARSDPHVPYDGGVGVYEPYSWPSVDSSMKRWVELTGCDMGPDTFYNDKGALRQHWWRSDSSSELVLWTTEEGGHTWPGTSYIHPVMGIASQAVEANDEMWEFFKAHPIPVTEPEPGIEESPACVLDHSNQSIFASSAVIRFSLERTEYVSLKLYDVQGREISVLLEQRLDAGSHEVAIDAAGLPRGVYFFELKTQTVAVSKPVILIK